MEFIAYGTYTYCSRKTAHADAENADESHIPANQKQHHRLLLTLRKLSYLADGWNGEGSLAIPERLVRRFQHHVTYVNDAHLANWELNATDDGKLQMKRNDDALLISWDELRVCRGQNNISVPFTKDNFVSEMERFNDFFIGNER